jgi:integrase/recombinase XerD
MSNQGFNRKRGYVYMLESNYADLNKFVAEKRRNECSENTIRMYMGLISEFDEQVNKTFREVTEDDVNRFIDHKASYTKKGTMCTTKMVVKSFYKWLYGLKNDYPPCVVKLEVNGRKNGNNGGGNALHLDVKDILTKDDIATLISRSKKDRDSAIISTIYESGARIGEFCGMCVGDLVPAKHGFKITVHGKTGARTILLTESVPYLAKYLERHPYKTDPKAPLWIKLEKPHGGLHKAQIQTIIKEIAKRAGMTKRVNPHSFRHARATFLARFMTDSQLKTFFGWTASSMMTAVYVHLSGRSTDDAVLRSAGIEEEDMIEESPLKEKICARCHTKNLGTNSYCALCGNPLNENMIPQDTKMEDLESKVESLTELVTKLSAQLLQKPREVRNIQDKITDLSIAVEEKSWEAHEIPDEKCMCGAQASGPEVKRWKLGRTEVRQYKCTNGHLFNVYTKIASAI